MQKSCLSPVRQTQILENDKMKQRFDRTIVAFGQIDVSGVVLAVDDRQF